MILVLAIIIAAAKLAGDFSTRLGQPAVLGELLVGLVLGPSLVDLLGFRAFSSPELPKVLKDLAELGVIFLMFIAGLETDLAEMRRVGLAASLAAVGGVVLPFVGGTWLALAFGFTPIESIFVGTVLTATSVSITAQTLIELGKLRSKEGTTVLGAAVIDDVLGILVLSFVVAFSGQAGPGEESVAGGVGIIAVRMIVFFIVAAAIGHFAFERLAGWVSHRLRASEALGAFSVVIILLFSWGAEYLGGVAAITGAYLAGVFFGRTSFHNAIDERIRIPTYAILVPVFFINIGLEANARELGTDLGFVALVVVVAVLTKLIGAAGGAALARFKFLEAVRVGTGMISRGEVALIVASVGLREGVIGRDIFAVMVLMTLFTTLVTPILLRLLFREKRLPSSEEVEQPT